MARLSASRGGDEDEAVPVGGFAACGPQGAGEGLGESHEAVEAVDATLGTGIVPLEGTTLAARPELAGTIVVDTLLSISCGSLSGTVQQRVVQERSTGMLDFYYRFKTSVSGDYVATMAASGFGTQRIADVDYRLDGLRSPDPTTASARWLSDVMSWLAPTSPSDAMLFLGEMMNHTNTTPGGPFFFVRTSAAACTIGGFLQPH
jgi:hypothetical protein